MQYIKQSTDLLLCKMDAMVNDLNTAGEARWARWPCWACRACWHAACANHAARERSPPSGPRWSPCMCALGLGAPPRPSPAVGSIVESLLARRQGPAARAGAAAPRKRRRLPGPQPEAPAPAAGLPRALIDSPHGYEDDVCHGTATVARLVLGQVRNNASREPPRAGFPAPRALAPMQGGRFRAFGGAGGRKRHIAPPPAAAAPLKRTPLAATPAAGAGGHGAPVHVPAQRRGRGDAGATAARSVWSRQRGPELHAECVPRVARAGAGRGALLHRCCRAWCRCVQLPAGLALPASGTKQACQTAQPRPVASVLPARMSAALPPTHQRPPGPLPAPAPPCPAVGPGSGAGDCCAAGCCVPQQLPQPVQRGGRLRLHAAAPQGARARAALLRRRLAAGRLGAADHAGARAAGPAVQRPPAGALGHCMPRQRRAGACLRQHLVSGRSLSGRPSQPWIARAGNAHLLPSFLPNRWTASWRSSMHLWPGLSTSQQVSHGTPAAPAAQPLPLCLPQQHGTKRRKAKGSWPAACSIPSRWLPTPARPCSALPPGRPQAGPRRPPRALRAPRRRHHARPAPHGRTPAGE